MGSQDGYGQTTRNRAEQGGRNAWQMLQDEVDWNQQDICRNFEEIAQTKKEVAKTQEEINKIFEIVQELQEKMGTTARTTEYNKKEMKKEIESQKAELKRNAIQLKENTETIAKQQQDMEEWKKTCSIEAEKVKKELKSLKSLVKEQNGKIENLEILNSLGRTRSKTAEKGCVEKIGELEQKIETLKNESVKEQERIKKLTEENRMHYQRREQTQEENEKRIQDLRTLTKEEQTAHAAIVVKEEQAEKKLLQDEKRVVVGGIRQGGDEKEDGKIIQEKLEQLLRKKIKQVVEWSRLGKKQKFSKRPRNVVLTFENSTQAEEFLSCKEEFVAQDGAIKMRKFRSEKEMQEHRLKMRRQSRWRPKWTQSWRRSRCCWRHS